MSRYEVNSQGAHPVSGVEQRSPLVLAQNTFNEIAALSQPPSSVPWHSRAAGCCYTASHPPVPVLRFSKRYHTFYNEKTLPAHTGGEQIYSSLCSHYGFQSPNSIHSIRGQHIKEKGMTSHSYHLGSAISVTNVVI